MGFKAYILYIEAEKKFDTKDEGKFKVNRTKSKIEGKPMIENKEKTLLKSRDIWLADHENKNSFESRVVCKAEHEMIKQFLIGSKKEETCMTIKWIEEDRNNKEVIAGEFGSAVLQLQNQVNKESKRDYKNKELLAEEFSGAFICKAKSNKDRQNKDLLAEECRRV